MNKTRKQSNQNHAFSGSPKRACGHDGPCFQVNPKEIPLQIKKGPYIGDRGTALSFVKSSRRGLHQGGPMDKKKTESMGRSNPQEGSPILDQRHQWNSDEWRSYFNSLDVPLEKNPGVKTDESVKALILDGTLDKFATIYKDEGGLNKT